MGGHRNCREPRACTTRVRIASFGALCHDVPPHDNPARALGHQDLAASPFLSQRRFVSSPCPYPRGVPHPQASLIPALGHPALGHPALGHQCCLGPVSVGYAGLSLCWGRGALELLPCPPEGCCGGAGTTSGIIITHLNSSPYVHTTAADVQHRSACSPACIACSLHTATM